MCKLYDSARAVNKRHPYFCVDLSGRGPSLAVDARRFNDIPHNAFWVSPVAQVFNALGDVPQVVLTVFFAYTRYGIYVKGNYITLCHVVRVGVNRNSSSNPLVVGDALSKVEPDGARLG